MMFPMDFRLILLFAAAVLPCMADPAGTPARVDSSQTAVAPLSQAQLNAQARRAVANLVEELRNAQASATGSYALATVDDQELIFYSKTTGNTVDRIHYYLDDGKMKKGITPPSGDPPIYDLDNETVTTVQDDVGNGTDPLFYYYDGSYDGVTGTPLTQPVNITQVRFVQVHLSVYNKAGRAGTNTYTVTGGATIRGLKTNLGDS